jgi:chromosomal replication initiation ATPase DnaA
MRRLAVPDKGDERILGSGEFVETITQQADETVRCQFPSIEQHDRAVRLIQTVCMQNRVSIQALQSGSRTREVSRARSVLSEKLVNQLGLSLAEAARRLGVTTAAIASSLMRKKSKI